MAATSPLIGPWNIRTMPKRFACNRIDSIYKVKNDKKLWPGTLRLSINMCGNLYINDLFAISFL